MARVEYKATAGGIQQRRNGDAWDNLTIEHTGGTVYAADTGTTPYPGPLTTNVDGEVPGWLDPGRYTTKNPISGKSVTFEVGGASSFTPSAAGVTFTPAGTIAATDVQAAIEEVAAEAGTGGGSVADASTTVKGVSKLSVAPADLSNPIAVGTNDTRMSDARAPTAHGHPQSDVANLATDLAAKIPYTLFDAKGGILVASGPDAADELSAVGVPDGHVPVRDAASPLGVKWSAVAGSGGGLAWSAVYVVAAAGASQRQKNAADYISDGVDDHLDFQAAHTALPANGGKIIGIGGAFNFGGLVTFTKPVDLELAPEVVIDRPLAAGAFLFIGSTGAQTNLSMNVAAGATVLTVQSTTGLAAGDWINLRSDEVAPGATNPDGRKGELTYIKSVDSGTQLTLGWVTKDAYTTATAANIRKINWLKGARRTGGTITRTNATQTIGISMVKYKWCYRPVDDGGTFKHNEQTALEFENCFAAEALNPRFEEFVVNYPGQHYGYGLIDRGCSIYTYMTGASALRTGSAFGNGSGADGLPRYAKCSSGVAVETGLGTASWSSHPECIGTTFEDCESHDALEDGFVSRGKGDNLNHPVVRRAARYGVFIRNISRNATVRNPDIDDTGGHGLVVGGGGTAEATDATVFGGMVTNTVGDGVHVNVVGTSRIIGTVVRGTYRNAGVNGFRIGFRNAAGDSIFEGVHAWDIGGTSGFATYVDAGNPQFWDLRATNVGGALIDSTHWQCIRGEPQLASEPVIASASTITPRGPWTAVTGTTNITAVTATYVGHKITLRLTGAATVVDGGNLSLAGNFVGPGILDLGCDGTNWHERGRSSN